MAEEERLLPTKPENLSQSLDPSKRVMAERTDSWKLSSHVCTQEKGRNDMKVNMQPV